MHSRNQRENGTPEIRLFPAPQGPRALFLVEAGSRKEGRHVRDVFDMVGRLATVVPVSHGPITTFAVAANAEPALLNKVEWLLKTQFAFSLVERNVTDAALRLCRSLCEDTGAEMIELPECTECRGSDPFPIRALVTHGAEESPLLTFCSVCAAPKHGDDLDAHLRGLVRKHVRIKVSAAARVTVMPEIDAVEPAIERTAAVA
jgi:hypothetical protein